MLVCVPKSDIRKFYQQNVVAATEIPLELVARDCPRSIGFWK